jgi:putative DNA primase/helicase
VDEAGELIFQVCWTEPKGFFQRGPDGNGGWLLNLDGVRRVPYRLPELLKASVQDCVYVTEGEKDTDRLFDLGLTATTCPMGAGKWREEYNPFFAGRLVAIIPDKDEPGEKTGLLWSKTEEMN